MFPVDGAERQSIVLEHGPEGIEANKSTQLGRAFSL